MTVWEHDSNTCIINWNNLPKKLKAQAHTTGCEKLSNFLQQQQKSNEFFFFYISK